jgi:hypothetical protein
MAMYYEKMNSIYSAAVCEGTFPYTALKKWQIANPDAETWWRNWLRDVEIMKNDLDEPLTHDAAYYWTDDDKCLVSDYAPCDGECVWDGENTEEICEYFDNCTERMEARDLNWDEIP